MALSSLQLVDDAARLKLALSPVRRAMLEALRSPASAAMLGATLGVSRQAAGYHLRALEDAGLVREVERRRRRGFVERIMVASGDFVVDPSVMQAGARDTHAQDRFAAEHLVRAASDMVREVTRMRAAASGEGTRLLTFTIEADISFDHPGDIQAFADRLSQAVADLAAPYGASGRGRRYRLTIGGHPAARTRPPPKIN